MYNSDTELLFPIRVIESLENLRGLTWQNVVTDVKQPRQQIAFVLMMVRMSGCMACNADSFRAMRGCTQCARLNIKRFKGSDQELVELYNQSMREVQAYLQKHALVD